MAALTAVQKENLRRSLDGTGVSLEHASALIDHVLTTIATDTGNPAALTTTAKTLVGAINELKASVDELAAIVAGLS